MKTLVLIIFLALSWQSYSQDVRDNSGRLEGRWRDTEYRGASGRLNYRIDNTGNVRSASGKLLLRVRGDEFRDSSGRLLGRLRNNTDVRDSSGRLLGRISDNGDVRDSSGRLLGRAPGVSIEKIAITFFFIDMIEY